jgi:hypothetical protein
MPYSGNIFDWSGKTEWNKAVLRVLAEQPHNAHGDAPIYQAIERILKEG